MNHYRIRVDAVPGFDVDDLLELLQYTKHVTVRHELPNGNPHYHIYAVTEIKDANLRKKLKAKFPMLTKTDYSVKKCDEERINEYVQYMFNTKHGNRWELVNKYNFDDSILDDLMENAKEVSADYIKRHKQKKPTGPTIYDLATEVNEEYKRSYFVEHSSKEQYVRYLEISIKICHRHRKAFEENMLRRIVSTAITIDSEQGRHTLISKIIQKEFRDIQL